MVLKFFESLDSVAEYIEKEENEKGVKYIRQSVAKYFGSESEFAWPFSHQFSQFTDGVHRHIGLSAANRAVVVATGLTV